MPLRPRHFLLALSGLIILALVAYREGRQAPQRSTVRHPQRLAPDFELISQQGQAVRLRGYLGRTRLVIVFYSADLGADRDPLLKPLIDHSPALEQAGIQIFGISLATPYANRQSEKRLGKEVPFPLLTDISIDRNQPATAPAHRAWGRFDTTRNEPLTGLFLVDRRGYVVVDQAGVPRPEPRPEHAIDELIQGRWPGP